MDDNHLAPDGYRYGVMFNDGSVAERWNGKTQRERAEEYASQIMAEQSTWAGKHDNITVARRSPGGSWERVLIDDTTPKL